jgi:hypothetical protein
LHIPHDSSGKRFPASPIRNVIMSTSRRDLPRIIDPTEDLVWLLKNVPLPDWTRPWLVPHQKRERRPVREAAEAARRRAREAAEEGERRRAREAAEAAELWLKRALTRGYLIDAAQREILRQILGLKPNAHLPSIGLLPEDCPGLADSALDDDKKDALEDFWTMLIHNLTRKVKLVTPAPAHGLTRAGRALLKSLESILNRLRGRPRRNEYLSANDLADRLGLPREATRKKLERFAKKHRGCYYDHDLPRKGEARRYYRVADVLPHLQR